MKHSARALLFLLLAVSVSFAQTNVNEEQGLKPYDSLHGGDIDHISLTNGGLVLTVPVASFPQRGNLDLSFFVRSSTKQWQLVAVRAACSGIEPCYRFQWKPVRGMSGAQMMSSLDWLTQRIANGTDSDA